MLFDLRGRGRRRTVRVIYAGLALLMGGGLVFFGVGSATSGGGLFDAFSNNAGKSDATKALDKSVSNAANAAKLHPKDAARWAQLTRLRYQNASIGSNFDQTTGTFTSAGKAKLALAGQSWQRYLALDPKKLDSGLASLMVQAYGTAGLNQLDDAVRAQTIVAGGAKPPVANLYAQLAVLAYEANDIRTGDLAAGRAVDLSPKSQKALMKTNLVQQKKAAAAALAQSAATPTTATPIAP